MGHSQAKSLQQSRAASFPAFSSRSGFGRELNSLTLSPLANNTLNWVCWPAAAAADATTTNLIWSASCARCKSVLGSDRALLSPSLTKLAACLCQLDLPASQPASLNRCYLFELARSRANMKVQIGVLASEVANLLKKDNARASLPSIRQAVLQAQVGCWRQAEQGLSPCRARNANWSQKIASTRARLFESDILNRVCKDKTACNKFGPIGRYFQQHCKTADLLPATPLDRQTVCSQTGGQVSGLCNACCCTCCAALGLRAKLAFCRIGQAGRSMRRDSLLLGSIALGAESSN